MPTHEWPKFNNLRKKLMRRSTVFSVFVILLYKLVEIVKQNAAPILL